MKISTPIILRSLSIDIGTYSWLDHAYTAQFQML